SASHDRGPEAGDPCADCARVAARSEAVDRAHSRHHQVVAARREHRRRGRRVDLRRSRGDRARGRNDRDSRGALSRTPGETDGSLTWTSREAVRSHPPKVPPNISPAQYALTLCSKPPNQGARSAPVSRSSLALEPRGTRTRWARR